MQKLQQLDVEGQQLDLGINNDIIVEEDDDKEKRALIRVKMQMNLLYLRLPK